MLTPAPPVWPPAILELEQMFHALESTLTFLSGRDQRAIFHKIRKAVENICHRYYLYYFLQKRYPLHSLLRMPQIIRVEASRPNDVGYARAL
jgi:hypothetical protein